MSALRSLLCAVTLAGLPAFPLTAAAALPETASDMVTTPMLDWQPCTSQAQQGFECATAQVPLDYTQPHGQMINLAVIRHRATGPGSRIGSIFANFGGPAAQGTAVLPLSFALPNPPWIFPEPLRQRFDIISWDPRGVGESTAVQCFDTVQDELNFIATLPQGVPVTPAQRSAWIKGYAYIAQLCGARNGALLEHVSTTETARDLDLLRRAVGDPQVFYWGDSYGTFLGATYANLFPDRIHAMVLLGNINAPAWVTADEDNPRPNTFLGTFLRQNSDKGAAATLNAFLALCGQASTNECAFSAGSPAATRQKWKALLHKALAQPVTLGGVTWDYDAVVTNVAHALYQVASWAPIADTLQQIWKGNNSSGPTVSAPDATDEPVAIQVPSQSSAVRCPESPSPSDPQAYIALADLAYDRSGDIGPYFDWLDEQCAGWPAVAADRYIGPWNKPTAHPLLLVNTTYDPATPYSSAAFMADTFANARLLTVAGYGHVLGQRTSTCANNYIAAYFINGTLPPPGTVCQQDKVPFTTGSGS